MDKQEMSFKLKELRKNNNLTIDEVKELLEQRN